MEPPLQTLLSRRPCLVSPFCFDSAVSPISCLPLALCRSSPSFKAFYFQAWSPPIKQNQLSCSPLPSGPWKDPASGHVWTPDSWYLSDSGFMPTAGLGKSRWATWYLICKRASGLRAKPFGSDSWVLRFIGVTIIMAFLHKPIGTTARALSLEKVKIQQISFTWGTHFKLVWALRLETTEFLTREML